MAVPRYLLVVAFVIGSILSTNARILSHAPANQTEVANLIAQHEAEIEAHGQSHLDILDFFQVHHGHAHDVADHDHNTAFLAPRRAIAGIVSLQIKRPGTQIANLDRRVFDLDRPPRS